MAVEVDLLAPEFETAIHAGPDDIATFLEIDNPENRAIRKHQAFETVRTLLNALGVKKFM